MSFINKNSVSLLDTKEGRLDGITLFRFTHSFRDQCAGGMEQYLGNLNKSLLLRNKMTIIQMYKTRTAKSLTDVEYIGKGKLIWVPSVFRNYKQNTSSGWGRIKAIAKHQLYHRTVANSFSSFIAKHLFNNMIRDYYRHFIDNDIALNIFQEYDVNIMVFHWISIDSEVFIEKALQKHIPFLLINHFDNQRLRMVSVKRQIYKASGFGGVSNIAIPPYLQSRFFNLSDSIDTDYFDPDNVRPINKNIGKYLIFFPSRITPEKGHLDAVRAIALLNQEGVNTKLIFAGICHEKDYLKQLHEYIEKSNLKDKVIFAGLLNMEDLRDYYAASDIVILPSYSEGLGRILLEAQAMQKPIVAYNTGGIPEAIQDGKTGYLVRKGDYHNLAARLKDILINEQLKTKMGISAREFILKKFNSLELTIRHENFYIQALSIKNNETP